MGDIYSRSLDYQAHRLRWVTMIGSLFLLGVGLTLNFNYRPFIGTHVDRMNATSSLIFLGLFVLLVVVFGYLLDKKRYGFPGKWVVIGLGKKALTIYYLQLFGIVAPSFLIRHILGYSPHVSWLWFFPLLFLAILALHLLVNTLWAKFGFFLSLEWFMAKIVAGKILKRS